MFYDKDAHLSELMTTGFISLHDYRINTSNYCLFCTFNGPNLYFEPQVINLETQAAFL
jgi:hypothetical protein